MKLRIRWKRDGASRTRHDVHYAGRWEVVPERINESPPGQQPGPTASPVRTPARRKNHIEPESGQGSVWADARTRGIPGCVRARQVVTPNPHGHLSTSATLMPTIRSRTGEPAEVGPGARAVHPHAEAEPHLHYEYRGRPISGVSGFVLQRPPGNMNPPFWRAA